jgi:hypothetical protein
MWKVAREQLTRVNEAIAKFESMPLPKRNRYTTLLDALYDQRQGLIREVERAEVPRRVRSRR